MNSKPILAPVWLGTLTESLAQKDIEWSEEIDWDAKSYYFPSIRKLAINIEQWARKKKFLTPNELDDVEGVMAKLMLIVAEIGEAAEAVRDQDHINFAEELADAIIRILHLSEGLAIPIDEIIAQKMAVNENRPDKHGRVSGV